MAEEPIYEMTCPACGGTFGTHDKTAKTCPRCLKLVQVGRKTFTWECARCGESFDADDMRFKYCPACRKIPRGVLYYNRKQIPTRTCVLCGKEFKKSRGLYCSPECSQAAAKKRTDVQLTCVRCGKQFFGQARKKYCSPACSWVVPRRKLACKTCGDEFMGARNAMYCSPHCKPGSYKRKELNRVCKACGIAFMGTLNQFYCHRGGCVSAKFRGNKIGSTYKVDGVVNGRTACAAVVCSKVDKVAAMLFRVFSTMNAEPYLAAFKQVKNRFLSKRMGDYVHRIAAAGAIFYVVSRKEVSQANIVRVISAELRAHLTEATLRKYMDEIEADAESCKIIDALPKPTIKVKHDTSDQPGITIKPAGPKEVDGVLIMIHGNTEFHHAFPGDHGIVLAYNWSYRVYCKACNKLIGSKKQGMQHVLKYHKDVANDEGNKEQ